MNLSTLNLVFEPVDEGVLPEFFGYLNDHCTDNGKDGTGYFLPRSQSDPRLPADKEKSFRDGLSVPIGSLGWRRAWTARDADRRTVGHVDLRSHPVAFAEHRCLLGMGVHREYRRVGLGTALLAHATQWALRHTHLEWIDLEVLSDNAPALRLYARAGFVKVGEVPEMFRIDGRLFSCTAMAKRLRNG